MTTTVETTTTEHTDIETTNRPNRFRRAARLAAAVCGAAIVLGAAAPAGAATGTTGTHYPSAATCNGISSPVEARRSQVVAAAPTMFAPNTTTGRDAGTVQFRQRLLKWNGTAWVSAGQASAVWTGFAMDDTAALDFSDGTRTLRRPQITFTTGPGYYAVQTDHWFTAHGSGAKGSNVTNAVHKPSTSTSFCYFRY